MGKGAEKTRTAAVHAAAEVMVKMVSGGETTVMAKVEMERAATVT